MGDLNGLQPAMREKVILLEAALAASPRLKELGYTFRRAETLRALTTQMAYKSRSVYSDTMAAIPLNEVEVRKRVAALLAPICIKSVQAYYRAAGLYAIGNIEALTKVTDTLESFHIRGLACDEVPQKNGVDDWKAPREVWQILGDLAMSFGLEWGGNWGKTASTLGWDCPHVQLGK